MNQLRKYKDYLIITLIQKAKILNAETIIKYYLHRWGIETSYKYLKSNLAFDKYRMRSILSIERCFLIVFLIYKFLELVTNTKILIL